MTDQFYIVLRIAGVEQPRVCGIFSDRIRTKYVM
jgi:hypothetical protein